MFVGGRPVDWSEASPVKEKVWECKPPPTG